MTLKRTVKLLIKLPTHLFDISHDLKYKNDKIMFIRSEASPMTKKVIYTKVTITGVSRNFQLKLYIWFNI